MKTKKSEFLDILEKLKIGLNKKDMDKQTGHYIFTDTHILVFNEAIFIAHPFENELTNDICGIPLEFYELLSKIKKETVSIDFTETHVKISAGKVSSKLSLLQEVVTEVIPKYNDIEEWEALPSDFMEGLALCHLSVGSGHEDRFKCICVVDDCIYSIDDARISKYEVQEGQIADFILLGREVSKLLKFNPIEYYTDDTWVYFRTEDNIIFSLRQQEIDFPVEGANNMLNVVDGVEIVLPEGMEDGLETAMITATGESAELKEVNVKIEGTKMTLTGEKERGKTTVKLKSGQKKGFEVEFCGSPVFLLKILEKTRKVVISEESALFEFNNLKHVQGLFV